MCRRLPGRLHSPAEGRTRVPDGGNALHSSRRVHRLRRVCSGLSRRGNLRAGRDPGKVEELHPRELAVLPEIDSGRSVRQSRSGADGPLAGGGRSDCPSLRGWAMPMSRRRAGVVFSIAALCTLALSADERTSSGDADLQFQLANQLFEENRLHEALKAFDRATQSDDVGLTALARKGKIRTSLKVAEFGLARQEAEKLAAAPGADA